MKQHTNYPEYMYKYQEVRDNEFPIKNRSIQNLINCQAVFSTRRNFNDLFDSKIYFEKPSAKQIESVRISCTKEIRKQIETFISAGKITDKGNKWFKRLDREFNKILDNYLFYCVSSNPESNLMWSHYANSHQGFCIEFHAKFLSAEKVSYENEIPRINMLKAWAFPGSKDDQGNIGEIIWNALRVKLEEWKYEEEYRFQLSNIPHGNKLAPDKKCILVPYPKEWVSAIVFGCRTHEKVKEYIAAHLPYSVQLKQAKEGMSKIQIVKSELKCCNA